MDFGFSTWDEICQELGGRLRAHRLAQLLTQDELAARSGVSLGTVKNLEARGKSSLESVVRIALALGLADQLEPLFQFRVRSIAQLEQAESGSRRRAPKRGKQ